MTDSLTDSVELNLRTVAAPRGPVAIVGAGSIGTAFAVVFALAGREVRLFDEAPAALVSARSRMEEILRDMRAARLVDRDVSEVVALVRCLDSLSAAVEGACYVQECAPENRDLKASLFARLDEMTAAEAILASSSSALTASEFAASIPGASRCLVVHPGNPPYLLRVVELVPAPFTRPDVLAQAATMMREIGLEPVHVRQELSGFVFNRLQGALLREAYCLVRDGVATVDDIDRIVRDGLGLRWSVVGPFETVDLNTRGGIAVHAQRLGPAYERMGAQRGQHDPWTSDLVAEVERQRRERLPLADWARRVAWRDRSIMALLAIRARLKSD